MGYRAPPEMIVTGGHTVFDPVDSTTYYFGLMIGSAPSTGKIYNCIIPKAGRIRTVAIYSTTGTPGTAETSAISIRKNDTTDYAVGSFAYDAATLNTIATVDIPVAVGDILTFKMVTPAWATNPLQLRQVFSFTIQTA